MRKRGPSEGWEHHSDASSLPNAVEEGSGHPLADRSGCRLLEHVDLLAAGTPFNALILPRNAKGRLSFVIPRLCNSPPLANDAAGSHTARMSVKSAALVALIGITILTILVAGHFVFTLVGVVTGLIPALELLPALVYLLASLAVLVFFFVFYRAE